MKRQLKVMGKGHWRLWRDEHGGTLAELTIIVPFLVLMVAAVVEFGRFFQSYTTLAKATRASARHLSNRATTYTHQDIIEAENLVICGKLTCLGGDELVKGITAANVCIEDQSVTQTFKVSIPRAAMTCNTQNGNKGPLTYTPIFDIGALLNSPTFSLAKPISPSTTMAYVND